MILMYYIIKSYYKILNNNMNNVEDDSVEWRTCCSSINKAFMKFMVQVHICAFVLILSCYKLINIHPDEDRSIYISLITLILGIFTPTPAIK